jgi:hypothetical protein
MDNKKLFRNIAIACLFILIFSLQLNLRGNYDIWFHLKIGEQMIENKAFVFEDNLSFTAAGEEYIPHEWLFQIISVAIYSIAGWTGLLLFKALLVTGALALIFYSIEKSNFYVAYVVTLIGAFVSLFHNMIRPHIVMWFMFALMWFILSRKKYWYLPVLFLFWGNFHSSVLLGILCVAAVLGERIVFKKEFKLIPILLISMVVPLISPSGLDAYLYPFKVSDIGTDFVTEWLPIPTDHLYFRLMIIGAVVTALIFWLDRKKTTPSDVVITAGAWYLAFTSRRSIPLLVFITFVILIKKISSIVKDKQWNFLKHESWKDITLSGICIILFVVAILFLNTFNFDGFSSRQFPFSAVDYIKANNIEGNVLNTYAYGGFLAYQLHPEIKIFMDGRNEVYGRLRVEEYTAIMHLLDPWQEVMDKYNPDMAIIDHKKDKINRALSVRKEEWRLVYIDNLVSIYTKQNDSRYENLREFKLLLPGKMEVPQDKELLLELVDEMEYAISLNPEGNNFYRRNLALVYLFELDEKEKASKLFDEYLEYEPEGEFASEILDIREKFKV